MTIITRKRLCRRKLRFGDYEQYEAWRKLEAKAILELNEELCEKEKGEKEIKDSIRNDKIRNNFYLIKPQTL